MSEHDNQHVEEEYEYYYEDEDEREGKWGTYEESTMHVKPILIGVALVALMGGGVFGYISYIDPGSAFDRAPVVNDVAETDEPNTEVPVVPALKVAQAKKTKVSSPKPAPEKAPSEDVDEAAEEPVAEAAPVEAPVAETREAGPGYDELLAQAKKARGKKRTGLLRKAIASDPNGYEAMARLSILLMERKTTRAEALELASKSTELNPDNGMAWLAVGYVHQLDGNKAEANKAYRKCAESTGPKNYVRDCRAML